MNINLIHPNTIQMFNALKRFRVPVIAGALLIITILGIYSAIETRRIEALHQDAIDRLRQHPDAQTYFTERSYEGEPLSGAIVRPCLITKNGYVYYTDS
jgi:hypothetical protein